MKKFGDESVISEAIFQGTPFDKDKPSYKSGKIRSDELADETELINFGFEKTTPVTNLVVKD